MGKEMNIDEKILIPNAGKSEEANWNNVSG